METLTDLFTDYTLRTVALGAAVLGITSGVLGGYAVLRRQSLLGDAISHAALPGIALAYLFTGSKAPFVLVLGAAMAGWVGTLVVMQVTRRTRVKYDSALGIVLSVFFGFGVVLLTYIQAKADASQAGLDTYLFGQAAALVARDVVVMAVIGAVALVAVGLFWKEFKLLSFDREFGASLGLPMRALDVLLTSLLVLAIVIGLQTVGVVLMSAILIAPAAAARQWTDHLGWMLVLAAVIGAASGVAGAVISATTTHMPTGPTIVLAAGVVVVVSLAFAPRRGLVWNALRFWRSRRRIQLDVVLTDLYILAQQHTDPLHPHAVGALEAMSALPKPGLISSLQQLAENGLVRHVEGDTWALTHLGLTHTRALLARTDAQT